MSAVFAPDLGRDALPDLGLSMALAAAADGLRAGGRERAAVFTAALAAAVRDGSGAADAGGLDAAGRGEVTAALEAAVMAARAAGNGLGLRLARVLGQWQAFARAQGSPVRK